MKAYDVITNRIIALLERGVVPWKKPWIGGDPMNLLSKREYQGINILMLWSAGFSSPWFMTFRQCSQLGGKVKKGSKGTPVVFFKVFDDKEDSDKKHRVLRYYTVFNSEQCDGIKVPKKEEKPDLKPIEQAEDIWIKYPFRPSLDHNGTRACYNPMLDKIEMPLFNTFIGSEEYYSTLFHEMGHSTGHKKRLNRKGVAQETFNIMEHSYSFEELVAELTSCFLCSKAGINKTIDNSASYINSWLKKLKDDNKFIIQASGKAQSAVKHILGEIKVEKKELVFQQEV